MKSLIKILYIILISTSVFAQKPTIEWVNIPAGTFTMGSPNKEGGKFDEELKHDDEIQHKVTLSAFKMSKFEVTIAQFKSFVDATGYITDAENGTGGPKGSAILDSPDILLAKWKFTKGVNWKCDEAGVPRPETEYNYPVVHISLTDANAFAEWLGCRLPTEAELEYACRAGTSTPFNTGENITSSQANYNASKPYMKNDDGEYRKKAMPVGSFAPNAWGLYDMHGNVLEMCSDWYGFYPKTAQTNPHGPSAGSLIVARGGSWGSEAYRCRSAYRLYLEPNLRMSTMGFRLVSSE